jgi:hypothetical protein
MRGNTSCLLCSIFILSQHLEKWRDFWGRGHCSLPSENRNWDCYPSNLVQLLSSHSIQLYCVA